MVKSPHLGPEPPPPGARADGAKTVAAPGRPKLPRSFIIIVFGPLVGATIMAVAMLTQARALWNDLSIIPNALALYLSFGYVAGLLPAIAAALLWRFCVPEGLRFRRRVLLAVLIGGLSGAILIWPFMAFLSLTPPNPLFAALSTLSGAIALLATTLPGAQR